MVRPQLPMFAYNRRMRPTRSINSLLLAFALGVAGVSCSSIERARPRPKASSTVTKIDDTSTLNIMRGTVGAETIMIGYSDSNSPAHEPIVVRGYGLVVDLNGTGSSDIPPAVRAHMLEIMEQRGVGQMAFKAGNMSPESMLASMDTAVVIVEGVIPPASVGRLSPPPTSGRRGMAIPGTAFDLRVYADPNTGTTSLEGGRLFTTDLRPGPLMVGSRQAAIIAEGNGPIFINPFSNPSAAMPPRSIGSPDDPQRRRGPRGHAAGDADQPQPHTCPNHPGRGQPPIPSGSRATRSDRQGSQ